MEPLSAFTITAACAAFAGARPITQVMDRFVSPDPIVEEHVVRTTFGLNFELVGVGKSMTLNQQISLPEAGEAFDPRGAIERELHEYLALDDGWDGDESYAPTPNAIKAAVDLLDLLPGGLPLPSPMVSAEGEVGFYWKSPLGFADVVVQEDQRFSLFTKKKGLGAEERFIGDLKIDTSARPVIAQELAGILVA